MAMRNGLGLLLLFLGSVAVSVAITRLLDGKRIPQAVVEPNVRERSAPAIPMAPEPAAVSQRPLPAAAQLATDVLAAAPPAPQDSRQTEAPARPDLEKVRFEAEQRFEMDAPPDGRSLAVERGMNQALERALVAGTNVQSIDCKRATCRVVLTSNSSGANEHTMEKLADDASGPFADFGFIVPSRELGSGGQVRTVVFVNLP